MTCGPAVFMLVLTMSVIAAPVELVACAREKKIPSVPALMMKYLPRAVPERTLSLSATEADPEEDCALIPA